MTISRMIYISMGETLNGKINVYSEELFLKLKSYVRRREK